MTKKAETTIILSADISEAEPALKALTRIARSKPGLVAEFLESLKSRKELFRISHKRFMTRGTREICLVLKPSRRFREFLVAMGTVDLHRKVVKEAHK